MKFGLPLEAGYLHLSVLYLYNFCTYLNKCPINFCFLRRHTHGHGPSWDIGLLCGLVLHSGNSELSGSDDILFLHDQTSYMCSI